MADKSSSDFKRIIIDMMKDMNETFPELTNNMNVHLLSIIKGEDEKNEHVGVVIDHCRTVFPERFFDILYQNPDMFSSFPKLEFLPGIDFCILWKENITDNTRNILWKYLQLILFTIVSDINNGDSFGDTSKLFQAINDDDFKKKLEDTVNQMHSLFADNSGASTSTSSGGGDDSSTESASSSGEEGNDLPIPDPKEFHDHITGMMDGKLGSLAKEIAEKVAGEMKVDMADSKSMDDIFQKLLKNPTKLMGLVKSVGSTLDEKLKSGDLKESELLQEAMEMMKKMKKMPGMSQMQSMFSKMGFDLNSLGGGLGKGGGAKMNMGAMKAQLEKNIKIQKQKEEMQRKVKRAADLKAASAAASASSARIVPTATAEQLRKNEDKAYKDLMRSCGINDNGKENLVFSTGEKYSKSEKDGNTKNKNKNRHHKNNTKKNHNQNHNQNQNKSTFVKLNCSPENKDKDYTCY